MVEIKIFECGICKRLFFNNIKNTRRFYGTRKDVRLHLRTEHRVNKEAGKSEHKGNRTAGGKDERSKVTQNCILYKEY
jgi:hypothetical protein